MTLSYRDWNSWRVPGCDRSLRHQFCNQGHRLRIVYDHCRSQHASLSLRHGRSGRSVWEQGRRTSAYPTRLQFYRYPLVLLWRTRKLPTRARDLLAQRMGLPGLLCTRSLLPHLLWEARLVQEDMVAPVGVVDHQRDLQVDRQEVVGVTLGMDSPGVRSPDLGTQFQQPGLNL